MLIENGLIHKGRLPQKAAAIVSEWCLRHQEELQLNWHKAQCFEPLERIKGADYD